MIGSRIVLPVFLLLFSIPARAEEPRPIDAGFEPAPRRDGSEPVYVARRPGYAVYLRSDAVTLSARSDDLRLVFVGAKPRVEPRPADALPARVHHLGGGRQSGPVDVVTYRAVGFADIYPGIKVTYYADRPGTYFELSSAPGAPPADLRLRFEGAERLETLPDGSLRLYGSEGAWVYRCASDTAVPCFTRVGSDEIALHLDNGGSGARAAAVQQSITFSTYLGGHGQDSATAVAADGVGNVYIAGWTESLDFLSGESIFPSRSGVDIFVAKLNAAGVLVSLTYLGGSGDDRAFGIAVDSAGCVVLTGWTYSGDFPLMNARQTRIGGGREAFVLKLSASGSSLVFSTYLGGRDADAGNAVALDPQGNIYVGGETSSSDFPILSPFQARSGGGQDGFVAKFNGSGVLLYSSYLGGILEDRVTGIAVGAYGEAFVTGSTSSMDFPVVGAFQPVPGGLQDAFAAKISQTGARLLYSTYLGGRGGTVGAPESGYGIAVDSSGCAYVAGVTSSSNFPVVNPLQSVLRGSQDAFVLKLNASGNALVYSTYLGGSSIESAAAIAVDAAGRAYVVGYTASTDFPLSGALQSSNAGGYDGFFARLSSAGNALEIATYFGGGGSDSIAAVALDAWGTAFIAGQTQSADFRAVNPVQPYPLSAVSAFVAALPAPSVNLPPLAVSVSPNSGAGTSGTFSFVTSDPNGASDLYRTVVTFASPTKAASVCIAMFVPPNSVYLLDDARTNWLGPVVLGTATQLQNSQCAVNGTSSSVQSSGNRRTLNLDVSFKAALGGLLNVYLSADDVGGLSSSTPQVGVWTVPLANQPPAPVSVTPSSGTGAGGTFTFVTSDPNGASDINRNVIIFASPTRASAVCIALFVPPASVYLFNDSLTAWMGPVTLGTSNQLQNSQCAVNGTSSSVQSSGNNRTLKLDFSFKAPLAGPLYVYLSADDLEGLGSPTPQLGVWTVPSSNQPPAAVSVSPSSGTGAAGTFTFVTTDPDGASDLYRTMMIFASPTKASAACIAQFIPPTSVYLLDDAQTTWMGPVVLGSAKQLQNSQCAVNGVSSTIQSVGNNRILNLDFTFKSTLGGVLYTYLAADDLGGLVSPTPQVGVWTVPSSNQPPAAVSVSPGSGSGAAGTFSFVTTDPNGASDLYRTMIIFASPTKASAACIAQFIPPNAVYLLNDTQTTWIGPVALGTSNQLQNSLCVVNGVSSSVQSSGNNRTLNLDFSFKPTLSGLLNVYLAADDLGGLGSPMPQVGVWTVP